MQHPCCLAKTDGNKPGEKIGPSDSGTMESSQNPLPRRMAMSPAEVENDGECMSLCRIRIPPAIGN